MHTARIYHTSTLLENGEVLITGGSGTPTLENSLFTVEIYNAKQEKKN